MHLKPLMNADRRRYELLAFICFHRRFQFSCISSALLASLAVQKNVAVPGGAAQLKTGKFNKLLRGRCHAEVVAQTPPNRVNMIRRIAGWVRLDVHQFQEERRPLHAVGVPHARLRGA